MAGADVSLQHTDAAGRMAAVRSGQTDALLGYATDQGPTMQEKAWKPVSYLRYADLGLSFYSNGLLASDRVINGPDQGQGVFAGAGVIQKPKLPSAYWNATFAVKG
jgi:hypothetical protein